ncbi:hypothetical protein [Malacoplasma iowae]|uniref:Uncharacterized protein n=1 Tax=Malacoplasma iowae 695 TaxID=1048830 RepID=A0A6P1LD02_MALIO|nr:hypothetical protein [Malacoplasma iowae]QHG89298.1 hypothetical protein EER00_00035 [Malacoplasma iowae 695]
MNYCYLFLNQINNDPINNSTGYLGPQSWVYYLIGAIFLVLAIVSGFFCYKYRNSKREFETLQIVIIDLKNFDFLIDSHFYSW